VSEIPAAVAAELARLRAENARLLRMLELSPRQATPPGPAQAGFFDAPPGPVHRDSPNDAKVAFFRALFTARADIYATRIENSRSGWKGWLPAVRGGWQRGIPHEKRDYLPLTTDVLAAHLKGDAHAGVYPLLDGDRCWWPAADFDGQDALTETLMYVKAGRAFGMPVALEVSRSGVGMHAWTFSTAPVAAETARRLGTGLLRETMAIRGKVNLASYDRLFPSQDLLPAGGVGNLIALPLFRPARDRNATVFLNPENLEPHQDQWSYPVNAWPHDAQGSAPGHGPGRAGPGGQRGHPACCARLHEDPAGGGDCGPGTARGGHPGRAGRLDACARRGAAARCLDAQPAVLREAADARLHLGHPRVPAVNRPGTAAAARPVQAFHRCILGDVYDWAGWRNPLPRPKATSAAQCRRTSRDAGFPDYSGCREAATTIDRMST
jgi:hypothetical protein